MTARRQATDVISPLQAFVFAVALSVALTPVLVPVLPGEAPLDSGDIAYKTFEVDGSLIVEEGHPVTQSDLNAIKNAGLLGNHLSLGGVLAATIVGLIGGRAPGPLV